MDEIFVEVYLPASGKSYDIQIPYNAKLHIVTGMIANALSELSEGEFKDNGKSILVDMESGNIFNINFSAYELGLVNGSRLMLI